MQVESLARIGGENEAMCWWCMACTAHRDIEIFSRLLLNEKIIYAKVHVKNFSMYNCYTNDFCAKLHKIQ